MKKVHEEHTGYTGETPDIFEPEVPQEQFRLAGIPIASPSK
jgi:hypothetical protein